MGHNFCLYLTINFFNIDDIWPKKNSLHHAWPLYLNTPCQDVVPGFQLLPVNLSFTVWETLLLKIKWEKRFLKKDKRIRVVKDAGQRHEIKKARYF